MSPVEGGDSQLPDPRRGERSSRTSPVTLADVGRSAAAALGLTGFVDRLGIGDAQHIVVCLIDGLGWQSLKQHPDEAPFLSHMDGGSILAAFPTTTPVGLATLGTGVLAGRHGLVGASFELPETHELLAPLQWGSHPHPTAVQPEPTLFETLERAGIRTTTVSPAAYMNSGLTRAVLRGGDYRAAEDAEARAAVLRDVLKEPGRSFTYVYWGPLDRIGHEFGVGSPQWCEGLRIVDTLISHLADALVPNSALLVTADHGMVTCLREHRIAIEADARLTHGIRRVAGEPRVRHLYTHPGAAPDVSAAWRELLGARADVMTRQELDASGLLGVVDPDLADRIGDVVVIARDHWMLASTVDPTVSGLVGQHGGLTPDEVLIPGLIVTK